jgi:hypothetical protein
MLARFARYAVVSALLSLGCSESGDPGSSGGAGTYEPLAPPPEGAGFHLSLEVTVPAGAEGVWCKYVVMPPETLEFQRIESRYTPISHHLIVYQTTLSAAALEQGTEVFDCDNLDRFDVAGFHYGTQAPEDFIEYPPGVGKRSAPGEVILVQYHAVNTTSADAVAEARVNFWYATTPIEKVADVLFFYDPVILLEPSAEAEARMHCELDSPLLLLNVLPHMHKRGVRFEATLSGGALAEAQRIVTSDTYEPETTRFDPPLAIEAGQAIDFRCLYDNPTDVSIIEGSSASRNEMCVFAGVYYTTDGADVDVATRVCRTPDSGPRLTGTSGCSQIEACILAAEQAHPQLSIEENVDRERCFSAACSSSFSVWGALRTCRLTSCASECADVSSAECDACVAELCSAQAAACDVAVCS